MDAGVPVDPDVREQLREYPRLQGWLRMRQVAVAAKNWEGRRPQHLAVEFIRLERADQGGDAGGPLLHLGRNRPLRRWGEHGARFHLLAHEGRHELVAFQAVELLSQRREESLR